jgi:hypothetical protein
MIMQTVKFDKKGKVKKNAREFDLKTVDSRLDVLGSGRYYEVTLDDEIKHQRFPRRFISDKYGGDCQSTFPRIAKKFLDQHGLNDWMFPNLLWNPHGPEMPGHAGLFFWSGGPHGRSEDIDTPSRVIVRLQTGPEWQYMGQYTQIGAESLTKDEWLVQDIKVLISLSHSNVRLFR